MPKYPKGSIEMKEYMKKLREMRGKNPKKMKVMKGEGIMSDLFDGLKNVAVKEGKKLVKEKGTELLNKGIDLAVKKVAGKGMKRSKSMKGAGFLSDLGKTVFKSALNVMPIPGIARDVAGTIGDNIIDKIDGKGMNMKDSIIVGNQKTILKKRGGALRHGGALRTLKI
jgi:hypothetical protein